AARDLPDDALGDQGAQSRTALCHILLDQRLALAFQGADFRVAAAGRVPDLLPAVLEQAKAVSIQHRFDQHRAVALIARDVVGGDGERLGHYFFPYPTCRMMSEADAKQSSTACAKKVPISLLSTPAAACATLYSMMQPALNSASTTY